MNKLNRFTDNIKWKKILIPAIAILSIFFNVSCLDNEVENNKEIIPEGIPTKVELSFATNSVTELSTKAAIPVADEFRVNNLYVIVFSKLPNGEWRKEYDKLFAYNELFDKNEHNTSNNNPTTGKIKLSVTSGKKRIYAIANSDNNLMLIDQNKLNEVQSIADFKQLTVNMSQSTIERQQGFLLMSGVFTPTSSNDSVEEGAIGILPGGNINTAGSIVLKRVDSRITFKIRSGKNSIFVPKEWRVINVPKLSYIYEKPFNGVNNDATNDNANSYDDNYFTTKPINFESTETDGLTLKGGSFTFYMLENRKTPIKNITDYQQREQQEKIPNPNNNFVTNGSFIYAHPHSAYVEMTGSYYETNNDGKIIKGAEVKYTVHMGFVDGKPDDFKSERNYNYTYNITINGIDNIKQEVITGKEEQPGAEGEIMISDKAYYFDSHYITTTITFHKDQLSSDAGFRVRTPFDSNSADDEAIDYKWVRFVKNKKYKYSNFYYHYTDEYQEYPGDNSSEQKDIKSIIAELKKHKDDIKYGQIDDYFDKNKEVKFTVFIDEFYYYNKPAKDNLSGTVCSWKEFVNVPNREMHILCNTQFSPDQESSITTSSILISQRSIKTFYNTRSGNLATAWGIETVNETERLPYTGQPKPSQTNGRYNAYLDLNYNPGSTKWKKYLDPITNKLQNNMKDARYICLQRNRDLNGNGKIDHNEMRWYMPSVNQLTGIWMGKDGLPTEAHLLKNGTIVTNSNFTTFHLINSNKIRFWAEEGSSVSREDDNLAGFVFDYRCVRNLGGYDTEEPAEKEEPQDYVIYKDYVFTLPFVNERSLKDNPTLKGELVVDNELQSTNRPYKSFKMAKKLTPVTSLSSAIKPSSPCADYYENSDKSDKGFWRMPNQRELSLMFSYAHNELMEGDGKFRLSRTLSSLSYKDGRVYNVARGEKFDTVNLSTVADSPIRCVRDVY